MTEDRPADFEFKALVELVMQSSYDRIVKHLLTDFLVKGAELIAIEQTETEERAARMRDRWS
jgi:hypothetical protein